MKRLITTHLNGRIFQIEEDGYETLDSLLASQWQRNEIEKQLADHFEHKLNGNKSIITCADVTDVCHKLGLSISNTQPVKRLYRQPKHKIIAGVCTGLGEYLNADPVIFRVIFMVSFFMMSMGFWIYIAMWIVTPTKNTRLS
jgi:phage shock protein C